MGIPSTSALTVAANGDLDVSRSVFAPYPTRTAVADANYTALVTDLEIAYTALTAARTVTLPAAANYPVGTVLRICDESGACSVTNAINVAPSGSDAIDITGIFPNLVTAYGFISFRSNGSNAWTVVAAMPLGGALLRSESVNGAAGKPALIIKGNVNKERFSIYSNQQPQFDGYGAGTSVDAPTAVTGGQILFALGGHGHDGSVFTGVAAAIKMITTQNWSVGANGTAIAFNVTANGAAASGIGGEVARFDQSGNFGLGTTNPGYPLTVSQNSSALPAAVPSGTIAQFGGANSANVRVLTDAYSGVPVIDFRRAQGTAASPTAILSGNALGQFSWEGHDGGGYSAGAAYVYVTAAENWSPSAHGNNMYFSVNPPGTVGAKSMLQLLGAGQVVFGGAQADQSKSVQTPTTGFSITISNSTTTLLLTPAVTLATGTVTLPAAPIDGQIARVLSSQTVTALTVSPNSGQSIVGAPSTIGPTSPFAMIYDVASATWYRMA